MEGDDVNAPSRTLSSIFHEVFPYYLYVGMTSEEFWHGDPLLAVAYRRMHLLQQDEANQKAWWQGYYNFVAVSTALQNRFRAKGKKAVPYIKEPLPIREKTELEKEREAIETRENFVGFLNKMKADYDRKQKSEEKHG